ncbi:MULTISPECIES: hypothetical protein, partial [Spirulina sp. CCY15215]|uniref:hypothetical protein n=1 Tax=Spirulina sp. CCY15215 TaxID=2767591 RepID=UPI0019508676
MNKSIRKNYLQPQFLYPLGAQPLSTLSTSTFVLQALRDRPELINALPNTNIFSQFQQHPFILKSLPKGSLKNIQTQWQRSAVPDFSPQDNITYSQDLSSNQIPNTPALRNEAIAPSDSQQIPPNIQRYIQQQREQAQNINPSSPSQGNEAIAPSSSQQIPPNLQKFVSPQLPNSSPTGQEKSPINSSPKQQTPKRSRFDQHPGTQIPANVQRDLEAQNITPSSPSQENEAIAPSNSQQIPPNIQRYIQQQKEQAQNITPSSSSQENDAIAPSDS